MSDWAIEKKAMSVTESDCGQQIQLLKKFKIFHDVRSFLSSLFRWSFHSKRALDSTENILLSSVKTPFKRFHVDLGSCVGSSDKIWTIAMNTESSETPIVLLHGYVSALAFWMLNFDEFATHRPVFAIDLLGFGKSSRPQFADDPLEIEQQYVEFLEKWRQQMNIPKMILLGHSLGGFISSCYALKYPERIEHLILADAWGFTAAPDPKQHWFLRRYLLQLFTRLPPFHMIRAAGPLAPRFLRTTRQDIVGKFESIFESNLRRSVSEYIYHCNNIEITGERAFHRLLKNGPWPENPIGEKVKSQICPKIPITFIYGKNSWIDPCYGRIIKDSRPTSYTHVEIVENAGHKVFSDNEKVFNQLVIEACKVSKTK